MTLINLLHVLCTLGVSGMIDQIGHSFRIYKLYFSLYFHLRESIPRELKQNVKQCQHLADAAVVSQKQPAIFAEKHQNLRPDLGQHRSGRV